jgi:phosphocarrier protein
VTSAHEASGTFVILNELGLHARPATRLVKLAATFTSEVWLEKDGQRADAKSVMGVLLLIGQKGAKLRVVAKGPDAEEAVSAIGQLIRDRFGEE